MSRIDDAIRVIAEGGESHVPSRLDEAIEVIEEARESHVTWAEWIEGDPEEARQLQPVVETAGDEEHHRDWIEKYDTVLEILEHFRS